MDQTPYVRFVYLVDRPDFDRLTIETVGEIFYQWEHAHAVAKANDGCVRTAALYIPVKHWDPREALH